VPRFEGLDKETVVGAARGGAQTGCKVQDVASGEMG
jgi:hypothetical protein